MNDKQNLSVSFTNTSQGINHILSQFLETNKSIIVKEIKELSLSTNQLRSDVLKKKFKLREINIQDFSYLIENGKFTIITKFN